MKNLFVMMVTYTAPIEKIDETLDEHRTYLKKGYENGFLVASGSQNPRIGGVIIGKFAHKDEALSFSQKDPFVLKGLASYAITEFQPILHCEALKGFLAES